MFDDLAMPEIHQRARGAASVRFAAGARLADLAQSGSAKAMLPRMHGAAPEVVFLNTAGGLTGGDRLSFALALADGARVTATTQTAERAYRAMADAAPARVEVTLSLGSGARADWLPQETILYDGAALHRRTRAEIGPGAAVVMAEMVVLGRAAMGEVVTRLEFRDAREVWSGGRPVWIDRVALTGDDLRPGHPALIDGARAFATLALIGPGAEDALGPVRAALGDAGHASGWDGKCVARLAAPAALQLRMAVARILRVLRQGAPLPRVWQI